MNWILAIPALPTLVFLATAFLSRKVRNKLLLLHVFAMAGSVAMALFVLFQAVPAGHPGEAVWTATWVLSTINAAPLKIGVSVDALSAIMLAMVSIVGLCVQVFSLFYMKEEDRRGWYFSVLSLFTAAMLLLVMAGDLLLIFAMWEIMGLCSYLLIGFWYQDTSARMASQKAFLFTRAADLGFFIALAAIFATAGTFELAVIMKQASTWAPAVILTVSLGLIWAAMGKSAQWPLMVWLPDAMAGPTPASALIHAATMVAAGVFMLARMLPVLALSSIALTTMLWIGIITALIGAALACFQTDLKKVLAYSTVSQLGLMFVALGAGSSVAALFHLTTHAFFKSLLFLAAGIIIHATHTQDMRKMGGLVRKMPVTTIVFSIGAFSLAGLVPLSGFFSKDEVLAAILHSGNTVVFVLALGMSFLTALYVSKTWFTVFFGKPRTKGVTEGGALELVPVSILAAITLVLGFLSPTFANYLGHEGVWPAMGLATGSTVVAISGMLVGYLFYNGVIPTQVLEKRFSFLASVFKGDMFFDYAYDMLIIRPYFALANALWVFDRVVIDGLVNGAAWAYGHISTFSWAVDRNVIDGAVNGLAWSSKRAGTQLRKIQSGRVPSYQRLTVIAVIILLFVVVFLKGA